ncbi:MAG TPA: ATP-binding cassette domain-containing protein [Actinomycetaceae bacterium]|nr:ATP-binding cassette domain-containing protein [Actinomycetaceae bacterium]
MPVVVRGITCGYGRTVAVDDVSLDVAPGELIAITGSNGSGKSTLLKAILSLIPLRAGTIEVNGQEATDIVGRRRRWQQVTKVRQRPATGQFPILVDELLESSGDHEAALDAAAALGVADLRHRPLGALSGGQLQRSEIARAIGAISAGAGVLLADEPTASLDFDGKHQIAEILTALPVTVLAVTHDAALANRCDRVADMALGKLRVVSPVVSSPGRGA